MSLLNNFQETIAVIKQALSRKADIDDIDAIDAKLDTKVDKIEGKELSTEDFTDTYKSKLDSIAWYAQVNVQSDWNQSDNTQDNFIRNKPSLATVATTGDYDDLTDKPNLATVATSGSYNDLSNKPTNVSTFTNDAGYTTSSDVSTAIANAEEISIGSTQPTGNEILWYETNSSDHIINSKIKVNGTWEVFDSNIEPLYVHISGSGGSYLFYNYPNCKALIDLGKKPIYLYNGRLYKYDYGSSDSSGDFYAFVRIGIMSNSYSISSYGCCVDILYIYKFSPYISLVTRNLEDISNKVTSLSNSSTDTQYPSAKLLYDTKVALETSFVITPTFTTLTSGTLDKTNIQILDAINNNKSIILDCSAITDEKYSNLEIRLVYDSSTYPQINITYLRMDGDNNIIEEKFYIDSANSSSNSFMYYINNTADCTLTEKVANKVTSISSSSTDTQYPSAKCVYDLVGTVETSLSNINTALAGLIGGNS